MAIFLIIASQALLLLLIASVLFTLPRPLSTPAYIGCIGLVLVGFGIALALDNQAVAIFDTAEFLSLATAVIVLVIGVGLTIRQTPKNRPAWLSVSALLIIIMAVGITILESRNDLREVLNTPQPETTLAPEITELVIVSTPTTQEIARQILDDVALAVANETGLSAEEVTRLFDEGASVSSLVEEHGGDLTILAEQITTIMSAGIEEMARNGQMDETFAASALASMPTIVRVGLNTNLNGMLARFDRTEAESTPAP
jgi:hypothetical protein